MQTLKISLICEYFWNLWVLAAGNLKSRTNLMLNIQIACMYLLSSLYICTKFYTYKYLCMITASITLFSNTPKFAFSSVYIWMEKSKYMLLWHIRSVYLRWFYVLGFWCPEVYVCANIDIYPAGGTCNHIHIRNWKLCQVV